jgi:5'-nucleotidase/UDP-sugar diphosphatase
MPVFKYSCFVLLFMASLSKLLAGTSTYPGDTVELVILYTNDLHAHVDPHLSRQMHPSRKVGGFARIAAYVRQQKQIHKNAVYVDAGDYFSGPYVSFLTEGAAIIDIMNAMPLDVTTIGNHEFDHGWQNARVQLKKANFPIVNANIVLDSTMKNPLEGSPFWDKPYHIIEAGGLKMGVIGVHGRFAFFDTTSPEMVQGVEILDEREQIRTWIAELKSKTDIICVLAHQGIPGRQSSEGNSDVARNLQTDILMAEAVDGIDVMVTGHAHQGTPEAISANGCLIVSTHALGMEVGKLVLKIDRSSKRIIGHKNKLDTIFEDLFFPDSLVQSRIQFWKDSLNQVAGEVLGTVSEPLIRSYGHESLMGNFVADAMAAMMPETDCALVNSGALRVDIPGPKVSMGDLLSAFPFPNTLVAVKIEGKYLKQIFEHAAGLTNGVLQVSHQVRYSYNPEKPAGQRVESLYINGMPLISEKVYHVAGPNFVTDGGDGYTAFQYAKEMKNSNIFVVQAMAEFIKNRKQYVPGLEGRIRITSK